MEKLCNLGVFSASRYLGSAINCHTNILGAILIQFLATWGDFAYHRPQPPTPRTCSRNHWPEIVLGNFNAEALIQILPILTCLYCSTDTDSCYLDLSICSMTTTSEKYERAQQGNLLEDDLLVLLDGYCSNSSKIVCIWQLPFPLVLPGGHQKRVLIEIKKNVLMIKLTARLDNNLSNIVPLSSYMGWCHSEAVGPRRGISNNPKGSPFLPLWERLHSRYNL